MPDVVTKTDETALLSAAQNSNDTPDLPSNDKEKMNYSTRQILTIALPVLLSLIMEQLVGLTDTAYLGRVGEIELGASAIAGIFYLILFMLGFGFSIGVQILIARRNGEGQLAAIGPIFNQGILFLLFFAAMVCCASQAFSPLLLRSLLESETLVVASESYLKYRTLGLFFAFSAMTFRAFYIGTTRTKVLTIYSFILVGCNILLNYVLIFGKFGCPRLGIAGAAIASTIAEAVALAFFIAYTFICLRWKTYALFRSFRFNPHLLRKIFGLSLWTMTQEAVAFTSWFIFFVAVAHLGERPLAITNVVRNVSSIIFLFINAFASTNSSLVSNMIGAGKAHGVTALCIQSTRLCFCFVVPLCIFAALFPQLTLSIYTDDPSLIRAAVPSLWIMLSTMLPCVPAFVYQFSVSGTGNTRMTLYVTLASSVFYLLTTYLLVYVWHTDVALCWITDHVYYFVTLLIAATYIHSMRWTKKII